MNLLPKDHKDFGTQDYWNNFFTKQKSQHFEWYGEYNNLSEVLNKYIHPKDKVIIIGCGNSRLSADLYDVGICNSISIDISVPVIKQMKERYGKDRPLMKFENMDVFHLKYENESFSVVVDKGTLDALLVDDSNEVGEKINKMFLEIARVLKYGGRYLCFSLLQEHVIKKLLDWFPTQGWLIRFHRCLQAESKHEDSLAFPIYAIVCTKMRKIQGPPGILEIIHDITAAPKRCENRSEVTEYVKNAQHYAFLKHYLSKKKAASDDICLELCSSESGNIRYRMFVVDRNKESTLKFAVFIVPQGRETEWLFSTPDGRQELASNANCKRLIVVHLLRNNQYTSLDEVKSELSSKVMELAPVDVKSKVPILSLGDDVGKREIRDKNKSKVSGEYLVEDVLAEDGKMIRRLIFLSSPYLVQSEVKLIPCSEKKKSKRRLKKYTIDFNCLENDHHTAMVTGFSFLESKLLSPKILLIGLGGGILPMFLHKHFCECTIDVVELDSSMLDVGKQWFNLQCDERLKVYIDDGLNFISAASKKDTKYDIVILDVDNKDESLGISSPPMSFLESDVLKDLQMMTSEKGVVIMNLACRNLELRENVLMKLKAEFKCIFSQKIRDQVNEVLYCSNSTNHKEFLIKSKKNYSQIYLHLQKQIPDLDITENDFDKCVIEIT